MTSRSKTNRSTPKQQTKTSTPSRLSASTAEPTLKLTRVMTDRECATVLHALRLMQNDGCMERCCDHFDDCESLNNAEIDELCEAFNFGDFDACRVQIPQAQESKTWTPPVTCGQCDATADSVLELAKHWKTSGHTTARVQMNSGPRRRKEDQPGTARTYFTKADECVRLCEAIAAFWGDGVCDAPIWPGAYLTEEDTPIRDLIRAAVGWRKPLPGERDPLTAADNRMAAEDDRKTPPAMGEGESTERILTCGNCDYKGTPREMEIHTVNHLPRQGESDMERDRRG